MKLNKIQEQKVEVFNPQGQSLGVANYLELFDLRIRICESNIEGFYIMFEGKKIEINNDGDLKNYPRGLFNQQQRLFAEFIKVKRHKYDKTNF